MVQNVQIIYTRTPGGLPVAHKNFKTIYNTMDLASIELENGTVLIRTIYASVDPYMLCCMGDPKSLPHFVTPKLNKPMVGGVIGEVVKSGTLTFDEREVVCTFSGWEEYSIVNASECYRINNARDLKFPLSYYLSVLGVPGLAAYISLTKALRPDRKNQTLFVSAALGAIGQVVVQCGKNLGLRVVGCDTSDDKVKYLVDELKVDAAFNNITQVDYCDLLKDMCPDGIDIYFDNVGGKLLDAVLINANPSARIILCGMTAQYSKIKSIDPVYNLHLAIAKSISLEGLVAGDEAIKQADDASKVLSGLIDEGKMIYKEDIVGGITNLPQCFIDMLEGKKFGKAIVAVSELTPY